MHRETLTFGDITLDRQRGTVERFGREVRVRPISFRILELLLSHPGDVFTRPAIRDAVWGRFANIDPRTVDVEIMRLRRAVKRGRSIDPVRSVRGKGYAADAAFDRTPNPGRHRHKVRLLAHG
jgi:two-component system, OmpR family, phosphate regulon response regulator PhoB